MTRTRGWLAAPGLGVLALGIGAPLLLIFADSLRLRSPSGGIAPIDSWSHHLGSGAFLTNYARVLEPVYAQVILRSLGMATLTTALCLLFGYPVARWIATAVRPERRSLAVLGVVIPFWTSFVVRTFAWIWILRAEGVVNRGLIALGLIDRPLELIYTPGAVVLGLVYGELPFMILPIYAVLASLDRTLLEAAADLGASPRAAFWRVTWPLSRPGVVAGAVLVFVPSVGQFIVSDLLGGARALLIGNLIQNQFFGGRNAPFGFALSCLLTALVSILVALAARPLARVEKAG